MLVRFVKIKVLLNHKLVVDVWRARQGEVCALGHDVEPRAVLPALKRAAVVMRQRLHQRGDDQIDVDTEIERVAAPAIEPRRATEILRNVVYTMGERLCPPGEDVLNVEIGEAQVPANALN